MVLVVIRWGADFQPPMIAALDAFRKDGIRCGTNRVDLLTEPNYPNSVVSILPFQIADRLIPLPIEKSSIPTAERIQIEFNSSHWRDG
jgi:hypothetical protein